MKLKINHLFLTLFFVNLVSAVYSNTLPPDSSSTIVDRAAAMVIIEDGKSLFNEGKTRDALIRFREAALKDQINWRAPYWISQCHLSMDNYGLAIKYAQDAIDLGNEDVDADIYYYKGYAEQQLGDVDKAAEDYRTALMKLKPNRAKELSIELRIQQCQFAKSEMTAGKKSTRVRLTGSVNSGYNDYNAVPHPDGSLFFVSRRSNTTGGGMNPDDQVFYEDNYRATWNSEFNEWDSVTNNLGRLNTVGFDAISQFYGEDGKLALMTLNSEAVAKPKIKTKSSDICEVKLGGNGKWGSPKVIKNKTLNTSYFEGSATMTEDESVMYFVSDRKGDKSSTDIYMIEKIGKKWGEAKPLPFTINTTGQETTPFVTPDGKFLFFSSDGHVGMGGMDIFVVERMDDGTWGNPINLGGEFNSFANDTHFRITSDGKKAYLSGLEVVGEKASVDIYEIDLTKVTIPGMK